MLYEVITAGGCANAQYSILILFGTKCETVRKQTVNIQHFGNDIVIIIGQKDQAGSLALVGIQRKLGQKLAA